MHNQHPPALAKTSAQSLRAAMDIAHRNLTPHCGSSVRFCTGVEQASRCTRPD